MILPRLMLRVSWRVRRAMYVCSCVCETLSLALQLTSNDPSGCWLMRGCCWLVVIVAYSIGSSRSSDRHERSTVASAIGTSSHEH